MTAPVADHGARWLLADSWTLTKRGFAHWARNPGPIIFGLLFNVLIVLMFAYLFGGAMRVPGGGDYREFLMPGMFVMTMLFGIGMTASAVLADVERGVTDRFRAMPMASASVLVGRAVADLVLAAVTLVVMVLAGLAIGWSVHGSPAETVTAFALLLLLRFALIWVGVYIGLTLSGPEAMTGVQTLEFPVGFLSSAFVSPDTMPGWLGAIAEWNPLSATSAAIRELFGNPGVTGDSWVVRHAAEMALAWPLVLLAIFLPLSVRAYRRLSR
ncbi:ABC transporter permease [Amycolatopsis albispora]|uniref:Transport permease protein n=1 Tax=Amycolatopsis albispora TaxID=1804986 RepID=A0A344LHD5_9PSEU|nr:ABC transporter permease [Amycolatopsis albispora]AXB47459.1 multidrug ABC transporter permease [Amycolatopsis albispora]